MAGDAYPTCDMPFVFPTRREFLTAAGAAVLAQTAASAAQGAEVEPVRVAVIGTGGRGSDLLRSLTTIAGVDLVAICDDYPPHLARAAKYAGPQARTFSDYHQMLDAVKPQAVVIAVPLYLHYQVATSVLAAGCDAFCEKTMCYSLDDARQLVRQVEASMRVFQVGLQRRANPIYQQAVAMVEAGVLGQITSIKCQWHRNNNWRRPVPVAKSDPAWPALEQRLNWRLYRARSQGLMAELGSHQMDVANWVLGAVPKRVIATGGIDYWRDGRDVCDNVFCIYEYELPAPSPLTPGSSPSRGEGSSSPGGYTVRATYSSLCNNAYEGASELILGTRGSLLLTSTKGLLFRERTAEDVGWARPTEGDENASIITSGKTLKLSNSPWAHRGEPIEIDNLIGDDTRDELISFVDHVRRRDVQTICDVHEGFRDTATVLMANQAMDEGKAVEFQA
jgi:predicted dehydrogenase